MSIRATIMGTACALATAAFMSQAVAAPLTGFAGTLTTRLSSVDSEEQNTDTIKGWLLGGQFAGPLPDMPNLNFELNASYQHNWDSGFSQEDWNLGASLFWAGMESRFGINGNYATFTNFGHITNGGVFGEWYLGALTAMAKGGWLSSGGSAFGGHGNYWGAAVAGYITPDIAITGSADWGDIITGQGCQICGREDVRVTVYAVQGEFLFSQPLGLSGFIGYGYSDQNIFQFDTNDNIWFVGLRWYTGGGPLVDRHRNGNLNPWLPRAGSIQGL